MNRPLPASRTPPNAADLLVAAAAARPDTAGAIAIHWVDRDRSLTYAEAVDAMARAAAVLSGFGVASGGRVGLFAHPGLDYVVALFGAWRLGATAVLVDLADKDLFHDRMTAASPDAVVYTNDHFDYVRPTVAALGSAPDGSVFAGMDGPQPGTVGWLDALAEAVPLAEPPASVAADSLALTTPTTRTRRTHVELIEAASAVAASLDLGPSDSTLCPTPLARPFHLEASILPALLRGATAGLLKAWHPDDAWEQMERHGTTVLCGTPDHCADLLSVSAARGRKPSALRAAITVKGRSPALRAAITVEGRSPALRAAIAVEGRSPAPDPAVEGRSRAPGPAVGELVDRFRTELGIDVAVHRPAS